MSAVLRNVMSRSVPMLRINYQTKANLVTGPPKNRISLVEKSVLGGTMILCILAPASYILSNLQNYKNKGGAEEE